jgi:hypothetical protein
VALGVEKTGMSVETDVTLNFIELPVGAGHVSYVAVRPRLCEGHYLRIAATREHAPHDRCQPKAVLAVWRSMSWAIDRLGGKEPFAAIARANSWACES